LVSDFIRSGSCELSHPALDSVTLPLVAICIVPCY
jgi:hypothetical protein